MRLASTLVRSSRAKRILDIGTGFGYSALWLAEAAGACARVEGIDRFDDHAARCTGFAEVAELSERVSFLVGVAGELLSHLVGPYGVVHEDAWFAAQPAYFERIVELLKPCGLLTMPNWFLMTDAIAGVRHRRWADYGRVARHDGRLLGVALDMLAEAVAERDQLARELSEWHRGFVDGDVMPGHVQGQIREVLGWFAAHVQAPRIGVPLRDKLLALEQSGQSSQRH